MYAGSQGWQRCRLDLSIEYHRDVVERAGRGASDSPLGEVSSWVLRVVLALRCRFAWTGAVRCQVQPAGATADKFRDWLAVRSCGHHLMHLLTPIGLVSYSNTRLATELHHIIQSDGGRGDYSLITQSNGGRGDYPLVLVVPRSGSTDGKVV